MDIHAVDMNKERRVPELIYLGNYARPYGVNEPDTWGMDHYFAAAIANGLRMLVAYGNAVRDEAQYEYIASRLEFYACDPDTTLLSYIDWSKDADNDFSSPDWLDFKGQPGFREYCEKSAIMDAIKDQYAKECFTWLADHWGELWD